MAQDLNTGNRASLTRMQQVANNLTDEELARPLGNGWTAGAVFGHLAFWDARAVELITRWLHGERSPSAADVEAINNALLPQWLLLPPRAAANLALAQADAVNTALASVPPDQFPALEQDAERLQMSIDRAGHRNEHMDEILTLLGKQ